MTARGMRLLVSVGAAVKTSLLVVALKVWAVEKTKAPPPLTTLEARPLKVNVAAAVPLLLKVI